jgi:hypothetical protein
LLTAVDLSPSDLPRRRQGRHHIQGSRVDASNDIDWAISRTIPVHRRIIQEEAPWLSILFGYQQQGKQPPSEPMVLKYFKTYYFATYGSTVFYRQVELSYLMHVPFLSPKYPDPLLLA